MKLWMIVCVVIGCLLGCGASEIGGGAGGSTASTGEGGSGGQATTGGSTTATTTATTGGGGSGGSCDVPGPAPCGPIDPSGYPDPLLGYDPTETAGTLLTALPDEVPDGAGAVWLGPFAEDLTVTGIVSEGLGEVTVAIWTEPTCGIPSEDPNNHIVALADDSVTLLASYGAPAGQSLYVARILTSTGLGIRTYQNPGKGSPRALWWGRTDADCDGMTDAAHGWAPLDTPTDPSVVAFPVDLAIGVIAQ